MLTSASQFGPRARALRRIHATATATASLHRVLAASRAVTIQHCQHTRHFLTRCEKQEERRRRRETKIAWKQYKKQYKVFKATCDEQLSRLISWDKHPFTDNARHAVKRMAASYWLFHYRSARHHDPAVPDQRTSGNKDGVRPEQNIEDVERGAMEHLDFGQEAEQATPAQKLKQRRDDQKHKHKPVPHTFYGVSEHEEYLIDPITNRKVAITWPPASPQEDMDIRVKRFRDYRKHCTSGHDVLSSQPPDPQVSDKSHQAQPSHIFEYLNSQMNPQSQDPTPKLGDLQKYNPDFVDEQVSSERPQRPNNDIDGHKPAMGTKPVQFEDLKPPHVDLAKDKSAVIDEVIAQFETNQPSLDSDLEPLSNEDEPQEKPLGYYSSVWLDWLPENRRPMVEDLEPGDFPKSTIEQLREKYGTAVLRKYTAVRYIQPDVLLCAAERGSGNAAVEFSSEEVAKDEPVCHNEPNGNTQPSAHEQIAEDLTKRYDPEELAKYTPIDWNEPDGQPLAAEDLRVMEAQTKEYDAAKLEKYEFVYRNWSDGQPPSSVDERAAEGFTKDHNPGELQTVQNKEPDWQHHTPAEDLTVRSTQLNQHNPIDHHAQGSHPLEQIDSFEDGLREMDARRDYSHGFWPGPPELDTSDEPGAVSLKRMTEAKEAEKEIKEKKRRQMLEQQMEKYQIASDVTDHEASLAVKTAKARLAKFGANPQLTGNYVRDFPEEFEKSWTETLSSAPPETTDMNEGFVFESQNMDGGLEGAFGRPPPAKIQPALDRHLEDQPRETTGSQMVGNKDSGPSPAQDVGSTHAAESSGAPASPADQASGTTTQEVIQQDAMDEPTSYKILAYDPTMQRIEVAETSSFVPDSALALTPADALLRLSHPARFFSHFAPLQAEGYEIISGAGDVLVFRKVRPETSRGKPAEKRPVPSEADQTADDSGAVETRVNPIDMTGRPSLSPASAYSASPTGYVNYNSIPNTTASKLPPPPPKIKYNIDVHREEPVFSGPKVRSSEGPRGKKSLGKRLVVGGVWVAGISYALGVIAEFFTTGGIDGTGPVGL